MEFNDIAWLGKDDADLGPAVRAGLGILIAKGDWAWWYRPGLAEKMLYEAIPQHGVATWAGDPSLFTPEQWLDPASAMEIGYAFQKVLRYDWVQPRLKIARSTWSLGELRTVDAIRQDLVRAMEGWPVFIEWPYDRRPRRAPVQRGSANSLIITGAQEDRQFGQALVESLSNARWVENAPAADIIIGTSARLVVAPQSADLAIVLNRDSLEVMGTLDSIRSNSAARCAVRLDPQHPQATAWLRDFGRVFSLGKLVDESLAFANQTIGPVGELLSATQTFILRSRDFAEPKVEGPLAYYGNNLVDVLPSVDRQMPRRSPPKRPLTPPPVARVLNATVERGGRAIATLPFEGPVEIRLEIRPRTPLHKTRPIFPDDTVEWSGESKRLQIHMLEVEREAVTRIINLPRSGRSEEAVFSYQVRPEESIDLRFVVADGVRILQTARLQGASNLAPRFFVETINATVEQEKSSFDLALLVNNSLGERPSAMALTREGIYLTMLDGHGIANARDEFRAELQHVASNPDIGIDTSLFKLASKGKVLLDGIKDYIPDFPQRLERVQLMTQSDAYFPLEYLYDGEIPENDNDGLCPERHGCLKSGLAKHPCAIRTAAKQLCPMGFLGVSAVIERQTWTPGMNQSVWLSQPRDLSQRQKMGSLDQVAFTAADRADEFDDEDWCHGIPLVRTKAIEAELGTCLRSWNTWKQKVGSANPSLLVLIPHVEDGQLHIGASDSLLFGAISQLHVGHGQPLVIAIGCNSAVAPVPTTSLSAILKRKGASVVVAALTEVLGRYANHATLSLVKEIRKAANAETLVSIGSLMAQLRRQLLAENLAIGLVLVAFGDADYALGHSLPQEVGSV